MLNRQMAERYLGIVRPAYAWTIDKYPITKDPDDGYEFQAEPDGTVSQGPGDVDPALLQRLADGEGERFRMLDDDGTVYFEGRILIPGETGEDSDAGDMHSAPLWDLGEAYGCVTIQYRAKTDAGGTTWEDFE